MGGESTAGAAPFAVLKQGVKNMPTDPSGPEADLERDFAEAREHHMAGRLRQAGELYQRILSVDPNHADALHLAGVLLLQGKHFAPAIETISRAIEVNPGVAKYHSNLGNALRDCGRPEEAVAAYRRALEIEPEFVDAYHNLGTTLAAVGRVEDGIASLEAALEINPDFAPSLGNLAGLLQEQERLDEAIAISKRALDLDPSRTELRTNLAVILLKKGDAQGALEICESCLAAGQQRVRALALKAVALAELGENDGAGALLDLDGLIRADGVRAPAPYDDLAGFNQALAEHIASHPSLVRPPPGHAQPSGWHTGELSGDEATPISALKTLLTEAVAAWIDAVPPDLSQAFWAARPTGYSLKIWGLVVDYQGHQSPQVRSGAWLGGVYHAALPPMADDPAVEEAGWIEFGRGYDGFYKTSEPMTRSIEPAEGLLVTFPAYFWHRTIPFRSTQPRVTVAFDVVPS
jgi:tetratricopeptide (TPR) repeat protein